jgi:DNA-binding Lrp family transcriptional regulator
MRDLQAQIAVLEAIQENGRLTQRDLAARTGLPLSYINRILKDLIRHELIKAKNLSGRRFLYKLTPKGFTEKVGITLMYLRTTMGSYREMRQRVVGLCSLLKQRGKIRLVLCGSSEEAEIVYLGALEAGLEIVGIVDDRNIGKQWLNMTVEDINTVSENAHDHIIVSDMERYNDLVSVLLRMGIAPETLSLCTGQRIKAVTSFEVVD